MNYLAQPNADSYFGNLLGDYATQTAGRINTKVLGIELDFIYFNHNYDTIGKLTIMVTWRLRG
ncbi:hypothetical protein DS891_09385 [Pseudoalteromonas sp. JC28]|nr:hypothetical protein [Pseudoalteromonas sp. JC28]